MSPSAGCARAITPRSPGRRWRRGSSITWKYPSVVLKGDNSVGEFFSVALTNNMQQADTGTKMIHVGKNTRSRIVSKGISAGKSRNCYRGLVQVAPTATGARNYSQCDGMLIGDKAGANTYPYIAVREPSARVEHEASTSRSARTSCFTSSRGASTPRRRLGSSSRVLQRGVQRAPAGVRRGGEPAHEPETRGQRRMSATHEARKRAETERRRRARRGATVRATRPRRRFEIRAKRTFFFFVGVLFSRRV